MKNNQRLKYLFRLFRTNKRSVIFSCFIFLLISLLNLVASYCVKYLVDIGIVQKNIAILIILSFILIFSQGMTIVLGTLGLKISEHSANKILYLEKEKILDLLYSSNDLNSVDIHPTEFKLLLTSYVDNMKFFFADLPRVLSEVIFLIIGSITVLLFINNTFVFIIILSVIVNLILYIIFSKILEKQSKKELEVNKKSNIWIFNIIHNSKEYIVNCGITNIMKKTNYNYSYVMNNVLKKNSIILISSFLSDLITEILIICLYLYLNYRVSLGNVLVAISFTKVLFPMLKTLLEMYKYYKMLSPSIDLVLDMKQKYSGIKNRFITRKDKESEFYFIKKLSFKYGDNQIFKDANVEIKKNGIIIFNSPNGTGKSTLVKILYGLLPVLSGETNINIEDVEYLPQSSILFPGDIYFNITLKSKEELNKDDIVLAENKLELLDSERKLNRDIIIKMDEEIISGGEKRLINLARLFYLGENKKIWILDEPDTGLDHEKKINLKKLLMDSSKNKLIILITHDEIFNNVGDKYFMSEGKIRKC